MLLRFCKYVGALRTGLITVALLVILAAPFADGTVHMHDWRLFPSVIAPTVLMMLAFTFPLDITMARIYQEDAAEGERRRLGFIIRFELILLGLMLLAWLPFMLKVLDFSPFS